MARSLITALLLLVLAVPAALAGAEVTLKGGRVLKGSEVKKEEGFYNLLMEDGNLLSIPLELVESIRLVDESAVGTRPGEVPNQVRSSRSGGGGASGAAIATRRAPLSTEEAEGGTGGEAEAGEPRGEGEDLAGSPLGEKAGIRSEGSETLSGPEPADMQNVRVGRGRQGKAEEYAGGEWGGSSTFDPTWKPESAYTEETDVSNFNPVEWSRQPTDPTWEPESAYTQETDVTEFNPVEWSKQPTDPTWRPKDSSNTWTPTDGFSSWKQRELSATGVGRQAQQGLASWYGEAFRGKPTASGDLFDPNALTGAHPTLPFGTLVVVTNVDTGASCPVKITDRGPGVEGRILNVSAAAARELGMLEQGVARVSLEVLPD
jgi:hypothetical protein